jgi:hypothetical protein
VGFWSTFAKDLGKEGSAMSSEKLAPFAMACLLVAVPYCPASSNEQGNEGQKTELGAKSLFYDPTSGSALPGKEPAARAPGSRETNSSPVVYRNMGVKYWVELVQPEGQMLRVTANRQFRSGEKVRFHFETNTDGYIYLTQRDTATGQWTLLFPDARVSSGDNFIRAGLDTILPSQNSWFTFDNNPGEERIMVQLSPVRTDADTPYDTAALIADRYEQQQVDESGSKSLRIEFDEHSTQPAGYVAMPSAMISGTQAPSLITFEISLKHR